MSNLRIGKCKGVTSKGKPCTRTVQGEYCFQHVYTEQPKKYIQLKPDECLVCYESMETVKNPLPCGHWIHKECIIESAKAECPFCRKMVPFPKKELRRIKALFRKRKAEEIREEEAELIQQYQQPMVQVNNILERNITQALLSILDNNATLDEFIEYFQSSEDDEL